MRSTFWAQNAPNDLKSNWLNSMKMIDIKLWLSTTNPRYNNDERMVIIHYFFSVFWENVLKLQLVQTKSFFFQKWLLRQLVVHKKTVWWLFLNCDMTCRLVEMKEKLSDNVLYLSTVRLCADLKIDTPIWVPHPKNKYPRPFQVLLL